MLLGEYVLSELLLQIIKISVSVGLTSLLLWILTPVFNKYLSPKWKYGAWLFLSLRLIVPFNLPLGANSITSKAISQLILQMPWLIWLWLVVAIIILLVHIIVYLSFRHDCIRWSIPAALPQTTELIDRLCEKLHITRKPTPTISMKVPCPMVIGLVKPLLLLPHEGYLEQDASCILHHEIVHYKRRDIWYKLLLLFACSLHWFNPAIWLMYFQANYDLELTCDVRATKKASNERLQRYSQTMLNTNHSFNVLKSPTIIIKV